MLRRMVLPMFAVVAMLSPLAMAQDNTGNGGGRDRQRGGQQADGNNNRGGGGGGQDWRQRFADRLKEDLGATDDEMKVIQPKLEKLMLARRDAGRFGMFGNRGGRGPGGGGDSQDQAPSPAQQASNDLRQTLDPRGAGAQVDAQYAEAPRPQRASDAEIDGRG